MGGNFNADTQQSVTQYIFTVPKQDLDVALHIESVRMQSLLATDALWDQERGAIKQEVARDLSNPQYVFSICSRRCSGELRMSTMRWERGLHSMPPRARCSGTSTKRGTRRITRSW